MRWASYGEAHRLHKPFARGRAAGGSMPDLIAAVFEGRGVMPGAE
jgi:hypothetical protein